MIELIVIIETIHVVHSGQAHVPASRVYFDSARIFCGGWGG